MEKNAVSNGKTLITGVIGEDVHITGIRIVEHALRKVGFKVVSLGIQISQEEFIHAAIEANADVILISSLTGHAGMLLPGLKDKCVEAGLQNVRLYLGGFLEIGNASWEDVEKKFMAMGFDRVYPPSVMPAQIVADLENDLGLAGQLT